jgi:hypothetical protein
MQAAGDWGHLILCDDHDFLSLLPSYFEKATEIDFLSVIPCLFQQQALEILLKRLDSDDLQRVRVCLADHDSQQFSVFHPQHDLENQREVLDFWCKKELEQSQKLLCWKTVFLDFATHYSYIRFDDSFVYIQHRCIADSNDSPLSHHRSAPGQESIEKECQKEFENIISSPLSTNLMASRHITFFREVGLTNDFVNDWIQLVHADQQIQKRFTLSDLLFEFLHENVDTSQTSLRDVGFSDEAIDHFQIMCEKLQETNSVIAWNWSFSRLLSFEQQQIAFNSGASINECKGALNGGKADLWKYSAPFVNDFGSINSENIDRVIRQEFEDSNLLFVGTLASLALDIAETGRLGCGRCSRDFSVDHGFYLYPDTQRAMLWAESLSSSFSKPGISRNHSPAVMIFKPKFSESEVLKLTETDWKSMVKMCRRGEYQVDDKVICGAVCKNPTKVLLGQEEPLEEVGSVQFCINSEEPLNFAQLVGIVFFPQV